MTAQLAVALVTLHLEWMTQKHWIECARDAADLDPVFKDLLEHDRMEESQHAKLDEVMVESLAARCTPEDIDRAIDDYLSPAACSTPRFRSSSSSTWSRSRRPPVAGSTRSARRRSRRRPRRTAERTSARA